MAVSFSVGTLDRGVWKLTEPGTPPPDRRVEALRRLTDAGISCGVLVAPVLPGLSDRAEQLEEVVAACAEAGAVSIHGVALHLRGPMRAHYFDWLSGVRPDLSALYRSRFARGPYQESPNETASTASCGQRPCAMGWAGATATATVSGLRQQPSGGTA